MIVVVKYSYQKNIAYSDRQTNTIYIDYSMSKNNFINCFYHELSHLIMKEKFDCKWYDTIKNTNRLIESELMASRIAKRLCPEKYFSEKYLISCLHSYVCPPGMWKAWTKSFCKERVSIFRKIKKIGIK